MKKIKHIFILIFITSNLCLAQEYSNMEETNKRNEFVQSFNICPFGIAFGIYSANYERLITPNNGIVLRADYEAIPKTYTSANIESYGYSFTINYRYHFSGKMNSFYLGAYSRFRVFEGEGKTSATNFDFTRYDMSYGLNAGKKWVWNSGININFSLGYGFSNDWKNVSKSNSEINKSIRDYEDAYDFMSQFYGELSIGYTF